MAIEFLIDENMPMAIVRAIQRHNHRGIYPIHFQKVGETAAPAFGTLDLDLLLWLEKNKKLLVSYDKKTLPLHFADHLMRGHHIPGIFLFKLRHSIPFVIEYLAAITHASDPQEWADRIIIVE